MIRVSAPGKTILMGEHAAVYGRPALVAAVDRRLWVELDDVPDDVPGDDSVRLDLPQIGVDTVVDWATILAETAACRRAWEHYREAPSPERFRPLETADPARVVRLALGETAHVLEPRSGGPALRLRIRSEIPIGAGFGSSAAIAIGVVYAYMVHRGVEPKLATLDRIALEVERRQHGLPSGIDSATVARGGILWVERCNDDLAFARVTVEAPAVLGGLHIYDTGTPAETTGTVVSAVRALRDGDRAAVDAELDDMAAATRGFRAALESEAVDSAQIVALIRRFEASLEALGVVPGAVRAAIRAIESAGGAAKISGAGGLRGPGAGSLLVYDPDARARESAARLLAPFSPMDVRLGADGVRCDDPS